jgi:hypothetical protein
MTMKVFPISQASARVMPVTGAMVTFGARNAKSEQAALQLRNHLREFVDVPLYTEGTPKGIVVHVRDDAAVSPVAQALDVILPPSSSQDFHGFPVQIQPVELPVSTQMPAWLRAVGKRLPFVSLYFYLPGEKVPGTGGFLQDPLKTFEIEVAKQRR